MLDDDNFWEEIAKLTKQVKVQPDQVPLGDKAIGDFCSDLKDAVNGINPYLYKSFNPFYNNIGCTISGDKIDVINVSSNEDCPDLQESFSNIDFPASIMLSFSLTGSKTIGWSSLFEEVHVYFREYEYEVNYNYGVDGKVNFRKPYLHSLLYELEPLLAAISNNLLKKITAKLKSE